ncbi:hypothetical protein SynSYN20_00925 [Synechococcus sp. SYN20]|nr:hypothetical protein SynSYN20_00925 [Synechococcus sp. SYN20]
MAWRIKNPTHTTLMTLTPKALAIAGAFYFFSQHHKPLNQPLIPGTIAM